MTDPLDEIRVTGTIERKLLRRPLIVLDDRNADLWGSDFEVPLCDEWEDGDEVEITVRRITSPSARKNA